MSALRDLLSRCAKQNKFSHFPVKRLDPLIIFGIFVVTSPDQYGRTVHGLNPFDRCVRICSFRVIIIKDTSFFCHKLNSMFHSGKCQKIFADHLDRNTICIRHCRSSHHIFIIVCSENLQFTDIAKLDRNICRANDFCSIKIYPFFQFTRTAEI